MGRRLRGRRRRALYPRQQTLRIKAGEPSAWIGKYIWEHPHLDYGYAITGHFRQGLTADRVMVHLGLGQSHQKRINARLAYVAVSRGRYNSQISTPTTRSGKARVTKSCKECARTNCQSGN